MYRFLIFLLVSGCSILPHKRVEKKASYLEELADTYAGLQATGWTDTDQCDALLFNSLRGAAGVPLPIWEAEDKSTPGRWYRRPTYLPECYASGGANSTISRDMLLGLFWYAWSTGDRGIVGSLWEYGSSRNWFMGDGDSGGLGTVLNSNMISLLARLCTHLGAECSGNPGEWAKVPLTFSGVPEGYVRHLEVLQILLLGELEGQIPGYLADRLALHATEQPENPLFAAAMVLYQVWDPAEVDRRLSSWPGDHLPTSADWCSSWRVESEGPGPIEESGSRGWNPCPEQTQVHSGGEILFLRRVLSGKE